MTTTLITGRSLNAIFTLAARHIDQGKKVVLLHEFPGNSLDHVPHGAVVVFKLEPDGLEPAEIAEICGAKRIINLNNAAIPVISSHAP